MQVKVRLYATLRNYCPGVPLGEAVTVDLPEDATVSHLIAALGIPPDMPKIVFAEGEIVDKNRVLHDSEELGMFPPIAGGGTEEESPDTPLWERIGDDRG
jgi:molybdopterin converting factor small subunit